MKTTKNNTSTTQQKEGTMSNITFKVEKMYRLPDAGNLKAFADVTINDVLVIRGVRVIEGKKGLFVSMPQEQGKDNKWYDQIVCRSTEVYNQLAQTVLDHLMEPAAA
ncbi:MAG: septation protein SpoVG family protein [Candidatus Omnitrophota bacterium]